MVNYFSKKKPEILTVFSFNLLFCFFFNEYREEKEEKNCKNSNFDGFKCRISCLENIIVKQYSEQIHSNMQWKTKRKKGKKMKMKMKSYSVKDALSAVNFVAFNFVNVFSPITHNTLLSHKHTMSFVSVKIKQQKNIRKMMSLICGFFLLLL